MIGRFWSRRGGTVDNAVSPRRSTIRRPWVKKTLARLAPARARLMAAAASVAEARAGLYTIAGLGCGTASAWVTWGLGAGLAGACVSLLLMGVLSDDQKGAAR